LINDLITTICILCWPTLDSPSTAAASRAMTPASVRQAAVTEMQAMPANRGGAHRDNKMLPHRMGVIVWKV
jgi:hypothetical protein